MINLLSLLLRVSIPLMDLFFKRSARKAEMKEKMFELAMKYDEQVLKNAKLRSEYDALKAELNHKK